MPTFMLSQNNMHIIDLMKEKKKKEKVFKSM